MKNAALLQAIQDRYRSNTSLIPPHVQLNTNYILFLDIDGTLSEFSLDPEHSFIAPDILTTVAELDHHLALFLLTGRSVQQAQQLISPHHWCIIGSHGLELKTPTQYLNLIDVSTDNLDALKHLIRQKTQTFEALIIEEKAFSIALHFRQCPELDKTVEYIAQLCAQHYPEFEVKAGKCVYELLPQGCSKGSAIQHILAQSKFQHCLPIFIGDDKTDECGFDQVNEYGGISIKVGTGHTRAQFRLENVAAVGNFLSDFLNDLAQHKDKKRSITCQNSLFYPIE